MRKKKAAKFDTLYNTLSDNEKQEFYDFLKSSLSPKIKAPVSVIEGLNPETKTADAKKKLISLQNLWNIHSQLTIALEQFLAIKELLQNKNKVSQLTAKQLDKRNLNSMLAKNYKRKIEALLRSKINHMTLREISDAASEYLHFSLKQHDKKLHTEALNMCNNFNVLTLIYDLILDRFNIEVAKTFNNRLEKNITEEVFNHINFENIFEILNKEFPDFYPVIRLPYDIFCLMSINNKDAKKDMAEYKIVKDKFFKISDRMSDELKNITYQSLIDFLIIKKERFGADTDMELFELFSKKEKEGLTGDLNQRKIGFNHFRDNVLIALNVGEIAWAEKFADKYSHMLPENQKFNDINTSKALICFSKGEYAESLKLIKKLKKTFYIHYSDYFRISIKANFELGNYNDCISIAERFRDYLGRNKSLSESFVNNSKTFIKDVISLINYTITSDRSYLDEIEISQSHNYSNFNKWIIEKYRKLAA